MGIPVRLETMDASVNLAAEERSGLEFQTWRLSS